MKQCIAIDGPAGSGKSTMARLLAEKLGYLYIDTGAMYRVLTAYFLANGVHYTDTQVLEKTLRKLLIEFIERNDTVEIKLEGNPMGEEIRSPQVDEHVSSVARIPEVRAYLRQLQRKLALSRPSVTEGRDIGTVILPDADLKIFLTASPTVRANRRFQQNKEKGLDTQYDTVLQNILERDSIDSTRKDAPLKKAKDAITVDTSSLSIDEVLGVLIDLVREERPWYGDISRKCKTGEQRNGNW